MKLHGINSPPAVTRTRTIAIIIYDGCEILDATAPVEVFEMANRTLAGQGVEQPGYRMVLLAQHAGQLSTSSGVRLVADSWLDVTQEIDTLIVPGSPDGALCRAVADKALIEWIREVQPNVRRIVSVCTGAFILAEAGLLDGRRVTTHWMDTERLGREYPNVRVEPDAIFIRDGSIASSAGVTAGLDLVLSLVEEDFGKRVALAVARRLVMYLKRPGGQTQFSTQLRAQMAADGPMSPVLAWLEDNYRLKIGVDELSERACMSPRNFARSFLRETGTTPARYVELLRLEQAIRLLEVKNKPLAAIALECGFSSSEQLRRAFNRHFGISPGEFRERF